MNTLLYRIGRWVLGRVPVEEEHRTRGGNRHGHQCGSCVPCTRVEECSMRMYLLVVSLGTCTAAECDVQRARDRSVSAPSFASGRRSLTGPLF
jgi:hypothetical protein